MWVNRFVKFMTIAETTDSVIARIHELRRKTCLIRKYDTSYGDGREFPFSYIF